MDRTCIARHIRARPQKQSDKKFTAHNETSSCVKQYYTDMYHGGGIVLFEWRLAVTVYVHTRRYYHSAPPRSYIYIIIMMVYIILIISLHWRTYNNNCHQWMAYYTDLIATVHDRPKSFTVINKSLSPHRRIIIYDTHNTGFVCIWCNNNNNNIGNNNNNNTSVDNAHWLGPEHTIIFIRVV
jgi:hypothetical protein